MFDGMFDGMIAERPVSFGICRHFRSHSYTYACARMSPHMPTRAFPAYARACLLHAHALIIVRVHISTHVHTMFDRAHREDTWRYTRGDTHGYTHGDTHGCTHGCMHGCKHILQMSTNTHAHMYMHMSVHMPTHVCMYVHTFVHAPMHVSMHMPMHTFMRPSFFFF